MVTKLVEVFVSNEFHTDTRNKYLLREVYVNPEHVVCLREDPLFKQKLNEGMLPDVLRDEQHFTRIYLNRGQAGLDVVVVGTPTAIQERLGLSKDKQLLRG